MTPHIDPALRRTDNLPEDLHQQSMQHLEQFLTNLTVQKWRCMGYLRITLTFQMITTFTMSMPSQYTK